MTANVKVKSSSAPHEVDFNDIIGQAAAKEGIELMRAAEPENLWESIEAFCTAIDWSERWIYGIFAFHVVFVALCFVCRRDASQTQTIFLVNLFFLFLANPINKWASANWKSFATQNYFSDDGFFIFVMYCLPLVFCAIFNLMMILRHTSNLLVDVKKAELDAKKTLDDAVRSKNEVSERLRQRKQHKEQSQALAG